MSINRHSERWQSLYQTHIIAVDPDRIDSISYASAGDTVPFVLLERRGANGIAVIPANEHDRARSGGGEVERSVEIPFRSSTLAEETNNYSRGAIELQRVSVG